MGTIKISTGGSFGYRVKEFKAVTNGHADAVAQAIEWLAGEVLPEATAQDHALHDQGEQPQDGFRRKVTKEEESIFLSDGRPKEMGS